MKNARIWIAAILLFTAASLCLEAQEHQFQRRVHFSGLINDFTPITTGSSPWELRGLWNLALDEQSSRARFSATLTMEFSDFGQTVATVNAAQRTQHTHRITMTTNSVVYNPTDCPAAPLGTPAYTALIELTGTANIEANGSPAPFGSSPLQVCIAGGSNTEFSNITLVFAESSGAAGHFGSQAIHGAVRRVE